MESKFVLWLKSISRPIELFFKEILRKLFKKRMLEKIIRKGDFYNIPIYIISFNRLEYVKQMVDWLTDFGYKKIIIIDNNSDYRPLLDYYKTIDCKVIYMKKNYGYLVFYKSMKFFFKRNFSFYILTDPDLSPVEGTKSNFVEVFCKIMLNHLELTKVGSSLKIDDLPDEYYLKQEVIDWEKKFYYNPFQEKYLEGINLYNAEIDTTLSLNSPFVFVAHVNKRFAIRVGEPYQMRHLPWYLVKETKENNHYCKTIRTDMTNWNGNFSREEIKDRNKKAIKEED